DLVYRAVDPPVVGLGFLAVRDTAAFLRWGDAGQGNPCAGALERAYVFGVSQSGRFLRHLLYLGLDETEDGRLAFDAVVPHVADVNTGGRGVHAFNVVDYTPLMRAMLVNLDRWVSDGVEPPPSAVPRLADGTAVTAESTRARFAAIPGVRFPDRFARPARLDFGPEAARGIAGELPPKIG